MESIFQIVEIKPFDSEPFELLVSLKDHWVVDPGSNINNYCKGVVGDERKKVKEEVAEYFKDLVAYLYPKTYSIPLTANTGSIKLRTYNYCTICSKPMESGQAILGHVRKCLKDPKLPKDRVRLHYYQVQGFSYRCREGTSYVIKRPQTQRETPTRLFTKDFQVTDSFIKESKLIEFSSSPAFNPDLIYQRDKELVALMVAYFLKERDYTLAETDADKAYGALSHSQYLRDTEALKKYARNCCPIVYGLSKLSEDMGGAVANGDIDEFGAILFKNFVSKEPTLSTLFNHAVNYSLFSSPTKFHVSTYRQDLFQAITALLDFILYDNLDRMETREKCDQYIKLYDWCCDTFRDLKVMQNTYHITFANHIVGHIDGTYSAKGAVHSIANYKILVERIMKQYDDYINTNLPEQFRNIDATFDNFVAEVHDDHGCNDDYYSIFDSNKLVEDANIRLRYRSTPIATTPKVRELSNLSRMLLWMIYFTVGPPYSLSKLLTLQYGAYNTAPRSLFWEPNLKTFVISLPYNKNFATHNQGITKLVPVQVAKYIVHNLMIVRPLLLHLVKKIYTGGDFIESRYNHVLSTMVFVSPTAELLPDLALTYLKATSFETFQFEYNVSDTTPVLCAMMNKIGLELSSDHERVARFMAGQDELVDFSVYGMSATLEKQLTISQEWHRRILLTQALRNLPEDIDYERILQDNRFEPCVMFREVQDAGIALFNKDFKFHHVEQAFAILDIINNRRSLACHYPSGSGKSLLYLLPVFVERNRKLRAMTVVVIPFMSSLYEACKEAISLGIKAKEYELNNTNLQWYIDVEVLFVQANKFEFFTKFIPTLNLQSSHRFIRRIVLDDFHTIDRKSSYRDLMVGLQMKLAHRCCYLFLSTTLNQDCIQFLQRNITREIEIYGESCVKKNVVHIEVDTSDKDKVVKYVASKLTTGKLLVLLHNESDGLQLVDRLSNKMNIKAFSTETYLQNEEKAREVYDWFERADDHLSNKVLVETSGFCHGLNVKNISHVLILGNSIDWMVYQQFAERLNRGDFGATGYMYYDHRLTETNTDRCINYILLNEFEGTGKSCAEILAMACSVCDQILALSERSLLELFEAEELEIFDSLDYTMTVEDAPVVDPIEETSNERALSRVPVQDSQPSVANTPRSLLPTTDFHELDAEIILVEDVESDGIMDDNDDNGFHFESLGSSSDIEVIDFTSTMPHTPTPPTSDIQVGKRLKRQALSDSHQQTPKRIHTQACTPTPTSQNRPVSVLGDESQVNDILDKVKAPPELKVFPEYFESTLVSDMYTFSYGLYDVNLPHPRCLSCGLLPDEAKELNPEHNASRLTLKCVLHYASALAFLLHPKKVRMGKFDFLYNKIKCILDGASDHSSYDWKDSSAQKYLSRIHPSRYYETYRKLLPIIPPIGTTFMDDGLANKFCRKHIGSIQNGLAREIAEFLHTKYRTLSSEICDDCGLLFEDQFHNDYCFTKNLACYVCLYLFYNKPLFKTFCSEHNIDTNSTFIMFADQVLSFAAVEDIKGAYSIPEGSRRTTSEVYSRRSLLLQYAMKSVR